MEPSTPCGRSFLRALSSVNLPESAYPFWGKYVSDRGGGGGRTGFYRITLQHTRDLSGELIFPLA